MSGKKIAVIGGGLSGISAAVFLAQKGLDVSLFESSPKLGGRTYSLIHEPAGIRFDNGKHILAGWYENTFRYLKLIGCYDKLNIPKSFNTVFYEKGGKKYQIKSGESDFSLLKGLLGFGKFNLKDKLLIYRLLRFLKDRNIENGEFAQLNLKDLISHYKLTYNQYKYFLLPFLYSVFNTSPDNISAAVFYNVMNRAFSVPNGFSLIVPQLTLDDLFIKPSEEFLLKHGAKIHTSSKVSELIIENKNIKHLITSDGSDLSFDYYVSSVPYYAFGKLFHNLDIEENFNIKGTLKSASILNVHLFCNSFLPMEIIQLSKNNGNITGFIGTNIQWMFIGEKHISLTVSSPENTFENFNELSRDDIKKICVTELGECLSVFKNVSVTDIEIVHEKRATFIPDCGSVYARPVHNSKINNLFVAGDWTSTGLPSTIESAVKSAYNCSELIN